MYAMMKRTIPGRKVLMNCFLSERLMGCRLVRSRSSSAEGGGILSSNVRKQMSGMKKIQEATKGIQFSETCQLYIRYAPTVLHNPDEKIKLTDSAAPST